MSVRVMSLVWYAKLPRNEKFVLLAYADHADDSGGSIFPAVETVAKKTSYAERAVQSITQKLTKPRKAINKKGEEKFPPRPALLFDDGQGPRGTNKWAINMAGVQNLQGCNFVQGGVQNRAEIMSENAPESSLTINKEEPPMRRVVGEWEKQGTIGNVIYDDLNNFLSVWDSHLSKLGEKHPDKNLNSADVVIEAIREMGRNNIRPPRVNYVKSILDRWLVEGYKSDKYTEKDTSSNNATGGRLV